MEPGIVLKPGGVLERTRWVCSDDEDDEGHYEAEDISGVASMYLFEVVRLDHDIRLRDIFLVLERDPVLQHIFYRLRAKEKLEEAFAGEAPPYTGEYDPEGIEYLELCNLWSFNSGASQYDEPMDRLHFRGAGFVQKEDTTLNGCMSYSAETRILWGISMRSPRSLLDCPLKISDAVEVWENDPDKPTQKIDDVSYVCHTFGQIINGILWELSFFGKSEMREAFAGKIGAETEKIKKSGEGL